MPPRDLRSIVDAPLNQLPSGLLSFFGLKQFGRSPAHLAPDLYGMMDLREFYGATNIEGAQTSAGPFATGVSGFQTATPMIVPEGQAWLLLGFTAHINGLAVGETAEFLPAVGMRGISGLTLSPMPLAPQQTFTGLATVTQPMVGMENSARWRLINSGDALGIKFNKLQAAGVTAIYTRFVIPLIV